MKIFKDVLTGSEVVCDNDCPFDVEGDIMYVVNGRYIDVGGEDYGISANVDEDAAEGATGEVAEGKERVVDVVYNNRYTETSYDKASYMAHIRSYMKQLLEKIENEEERKAFQTNAAAFVKKVLKDIDEYQFFIPEGNDEDPDNGMIVLCRWDGETPRFYFWKDGLKGERV
ncbi:putative IgE-dependent histamine-releasing factor [Leishmania major strain Friedlin]|uniref:Putative IgE-dependent histamine-releasing factor n=1 Tax=Leishmania major TaxID=5664 RepID=Q4QAI0_LEIMA|nr:putative IgE-dependent histamine-releasing factor [Leishmania major strain Friedlin]XP_001683668.1 putative IgE-dependent histamine-releasing factor [Leishmania major strain Friedlin]CAG9574623.1 translationally_controlled_tumor_protein_(TCTP)_-_putative [Leishmania major strain Friedlin]CAG9574624.1 translationally_controlled_tumor_protein_(TCTP)_-_putative [Leishmania major strain Friedlin]CAJ05083.1 putative IgE-dependent histamine-releasing factor [Leishmania major strain Friedlin]CAJ05|eukprot:XP_001683667.1 putative IgE-dependent histamine-releasing factor [Leishmania major strain Friedlin]